MRLELMKRVADHDNNQLDELVAQKKELEKLEAECKSLIDELKESANAYNNKLKELDEQKSKLAAMQTKSGKKIVELEEQKQTLVAQSGCWNASTRR